MSGSGAGGDRELEPVRWRGAALPALVAFVVGVALAPLVRSLLVFAIRRLVP